MSKSDRSRVIRFAQVRIPDPAGERSDNFMQRGTLDVALSLAPSTNQQTPHAQDEIYVIIPGRGILFHDGEGEPFESGDLVFVAAGIEHRFGEISEDLAVWRVFYGAEGGEVPA